MDELKRFTVLFFLAAFALAAMLAGGVNADVHLHGVMALAVAAVGVAWVQQLDRCQDERARVRAVLVRTRSVPRQKRTRRNDPLLI